MCRGVLGPYSGRKVGTFPRAEERNEELFYYGGYSHDLAKERMETILRDVERDRLAKRIRSITKVPRTGVSPRSSAFVTALFR